MLYFLFSVTNSVLTNWQVFTSPKIPVGKLLKEFKLFANNYHQEWFTIKDSVYEQIPAFKYLSLVACVINLRIITKRFTALAINYILKAKWLGLQKTLWRLLPFSQIKWIRKLGLKSILISKNQSPEIMHISTNKRLEKRMVSSYKVTLCSLKKE